MGSDFQKINNNSKTLAICFSGIWLAIDKIPVFEFSNSLSSPELNLDILLLRDFEEFWYLKGLKDTCNNFDSFLLFLQNEINKYDKVVAIGASAGGYASILATSLLNFDGCISFIPQTDLKTASEHNNWSFKKISPILNTSIGKKYQNLSKHMNNVSKYYIYSYDNDNKLHGSHQFNNVSHHCNVFRLPHGAKRMIKDNSLVDLILEF